MSPTVILIGWDIHLALRQLIDHNNLFRGHGARNKGFLDVEAR
jgi:hypothetical protein